MAITYRVSKTKNPQGIEGVNYLANKFVKTSDYTFEELAEDINNSTTVTQADAFAVLKAMKKYIKQALLAGRRVVLSDLGALRMSITGKTFTQDELKDKEFTPSSRIKGIGVNFRPEAKLQRVASEHAAEECARVHAFFADEDELLGDKYMSEFLRHYPEQHCHRIHSGHHLSEEGARVIIDYLDSMR